MFTRKQVYYQNIYMNNIQAKLEKIIKTGSVEKDVGISTYTTMKIGGKANFLVKTADVNEIRKLQQFCKLKKIKLFILAGGSNLIFKDEGFNGVILKVLSTDFKIIEKGSRPVVEFNAGYSSHLASVKMMELGFSGFEGLYGLPGSLGGAIYQNSKWPKNNYQISDNLISLQHLDENGILNQTNRHDLEFSYGYSSFQKNNHIILSAQFEFTPKNIEEIKKHSLEVMAYRRLSQPIGVATAGCVFKNIGEELQKKYNWPTCSAGYFIDKSGLKKTRVNNLQISDVHANFFVNTKSATSKDYLELVSLIKKKVKEKFGIDLKEEVRIVE